jgi:hypothetical protein
MRAGKACVPGVSRREEEASELILFDPEVEVFDIAEDAAAGADGTPATGVVNNYKYEWTGRDLGDFTASRRTPGSASAM